MIPDPNSEQYLNDPDFQSLLVSCLEQLERGEPLDSEELLAAHPDHADALEQFLADQAMLQRVASQVRDSHVGRGRIEETIDSNPHGNGFSSGDRIRYIGEYEILDEIARGGMGIVFKARQQKLDRIVALKMILSGQLADEADVQRFHREAQAAGKLRHPVIVAVHEIGQHEGHHYFTMDYIQGHSLADEIRDETLSPARAADLVKEVSEAVHFAHQQGTTHRDLKPANILIDEQQRPHVTDFGLAKIVCDDDTRAHLTATGQILGTPSYMSPEQASGKAELTGPASDIYSLGAILYACLTGRAPFVAESPVETLLQVVKKDPVSPRQLTPSIPKDLETICLKCLSKEPKQRYQTAQNLADDLDCWLAGKPIKARPVGPLKRAWKWSRRHPAWTALMLVLVLSTGVVTWLWRQAESASELANAATKRAESASELASVQLYVNQVALAEREWQVQNRDRATEILLQCQPERRGWEWQLASRLCFASPNVNLETPGGRVSIIRYSETGKYLATADEQGIAIRDGESLAVLGLIEGEFNSLEFLPGSEEFVATTGDQIDLYSARTAELVREIARGNPPIRILSVESNGNRLAIEEKASFSIVDVTSGERTEFLPLAEKRMANFVGARFLSDGKHLVVTFSATISVYDLATKEIIESPDVQLRFTKGSRSFSINPESVGAISSDGNRIAIIGSRGAGNPAVAVYDRSSEKVSVVYPGAGGLASGISSVRFHPDGRSIVIACVQTYVGPKHIDNEKNKEQGFFTPGPAAGAMHIRSSESAVFVHDIHSGRLMFQSHGFIGGVARDGLAIHPSGTRIATAGGYGNPMNYKNRTIRGELKVWNQGDVSPSIALRGHEYPVTRVAISPDGKLIASGDESGQVRVWRASGELIRILNSEDEAIKGLAFANQGQELVIADHEHIVWWNLVDDRETGRIDSDTKSTLDWDKDLLSLRGSASGKFVAYHSSKRAVVLDAATRLEVLALDRTFIEKTLRSDDGDYPHERTSGVFLDPTERLIATTYYFDLHGELRTWNLATGRPGIHVETEQVGNPFRTGWGLLNAAFSPDGSRVVGVGNNGPAIVWDISSGKKIMELKGHSGFIWAVAFSPDGSRIATGSHDDTIKLWDATTGQEVLTLRGHTDDVLDIAFTPDGKRLISVANDKTVRIWNADLQGVAQELAPWSGDIAPVPELTPVDFASHRQIVWGRDMVLAFSAYRQLVQEFVETPFQHEHKHYGRKTLPDKQKLRNHVVQWTREERNKVVELNRNVAGGGIPDEAIEKELDTELERVFERVFEAEYKRLMDVMNKKVGR